MGDEQPPLVNRVSASENPDIQNIWSEDDERTVGGVSTGALDQSKLPKGCTIIREERIADGKRRFVLRESDEPA